MNAEFFSQWSPSMAYWLGFMYADGNVSWNSRTKIYQIALRLKCSDYVHIKKFADAVQSSFHVGVIANCKSAFNENCRASTIINNKQMAESLMNLGCVPRKSLKLEWNPSIPQHLVHHFVRGYFDGDGCIAFDVA